MTLFRRSKLSMLNCTILAVMFAGSAFAATTQTRQISEGEQAKVLGVILSRDGDLVRVREKKSHDVIAVSIGDSTKIERDKHKFPFYRHTDMDVTALVPGLTIRVEGLGNSNGQLEASKISFTPDEFAVEVAEERQVLANKTSAQNAQATANDAGTAASAAQASADQAQDTADQAGFLGVADAVAVAAVNQRVSDLDDYKIETENDVYFERDSAVLKEEAKPALADLARIAKSLPGYLIEISGYASNTLANKTDQKLSEERASAVARYFYEVQNIPMRRILVPVGYGRTHQVASNANALGRELNRRVDVKVLVNKSMEEGL